MIDLLTVYTLNKCVYIWKQIPHSYLYDVDQLGHTGGQRAMPGPRPPIIKSANIDYLLILW
jgi:hypothetical protein